MLSIKFVALIALWSVLGLLIEPTVAQDSNNYNAQTAIIVAEGAGTSADDALKDAFRNAVRQTVGALVDAETLIKNDEVIDDKVLTYSDGFIKTYEEVAGSKKIQGGLHRIKVKAQVERRSVIARLKESKISVKEFDGKGLFADAITNEEARKNSTEIIKKALADLDKMWIAEPIGQPEFDNETSEIVVKVGVKIDSVKYNAFFEKVSPILDKVALRKTTFISKAEPRGDKSSNNDPIERFVITSLSLEDQPLSEEESKTHWKLLVCHPPRSDLASLRWTMYVVDAAASEVLSSIELPVNPSTPINVSPALLVVELCNSTGEIVTDDETIIRHGFYTTNHLKRIVGVGDFCPVLTTCLEQYQDAYGRMNSVLSFNNYSSNDVQLAISDMPIFVRDRAITGISPRRFYFRAYVGPFIFSDRGDKKYISYRPVAEYERRIKASLDELKAIQSVRCKLVRE